MSAADDREAGAGWNIFACDYVCAHGNQGSQCAGAGPGSWGASGPQGEELGMVSASAGLSVATHTDCKQIFAAVELSCSCVARS
jgi:hypothetical protein